MYPRTLGIFAYFTHGRTYVILTYVGMYVHTYLREKDWNVCVQQKRIIVKVGFSIGEGRGGG